jgi:glycosyltransferase involved in cell wall biosynthesis
LRGFLESAARLFVPSAAAASFFTRRYPELADRVRVVEHGIPGPRRRPVDAGTVPRTSANPLRVAVIGGLNAHKGQGVLLELLERNTDEAIEFHFFGAAEGRELAALPAGPAGRVRGSRLTYHGRYEPDRIVELLSAAHIDLGLQLSTWPETFAYTLSEYAMAGVPVVALPRGAVGERVSRDRLGWIVDDVAGVLATLEALARAPAAITRCASAMDQAAAARPVEPMRAAYEEAWREVAAASPRRRTSGGERRAVWDYLLAVDLPSGGSAGPSRAEADLAAFRQWMRSPRYQLADAVFRALERIPILWPAVVRLGERIRGAR